MVATMIAAPPTPATARPMMSVTKFWETAAMSEPISKMPMAGDDRQFVIQGGRARKGLSQEGKGSCEASLVVWQRGARGRTRGLTHHERHFLVEVGEDLAPEEDGGALLESVETIWTLSGPAQAAVIDAYARALDDVFLLGAAAGALGVVFALR